MTHTINGKITNPDCSTGPEELDSPRIRKGMFLLSKRGPARELYRFRAYDWGTFSADVYADLDELTARGYLDTSRVPGRTWVKYRVTARGHDAALRIVGDIGQADTRWLKSAREYLTTRSFAQLLREIYAEYPTFAVSSRFQG